MRRLITEVGEWFDRRLQLATPLGESGGRRGPALDSVAVRLTQDQLIRQLIQGGGNMPAYGKNLSPAETTALVAFLETLHPVGQTPAHNAALDHGESKN
jgi:ubiquinol-cytochrome c reductase cytochrome b subunit